MLTNPIKPQSNYETTQKQIDKREARDGLKNRIAELSQKISTLETFSKSWLGWFTRLTQDFNEGPSRPSLLFFELYSIKNDFDKLQRDLRFLASEKQISCSQANKIQKSLETIKEQARQLQTSYT